MLNRILCARLAPSSARLLPCSLAGLGRYLYLVALAPCLILLTGVGKVVAQETIVRSAEATFNNDGTISLSIMLDNGNPVSLQLLVNPPVQAAAASAQNCISSGKTYVEAFENYQNSCQLPITDCDPYDGEWYCSHTALTERPVLESQVQNTSANVTIVSINNVSLSADDTTAGQHTMQETLEPSPPSVVVTLPNPVVDPVIETDNNASTAVENSSSSTNPAIGKIAAGDLLVLHYDNAPDPDDGHALVAGRVLRDYYGLNSVLAVNGAHGHQRRNDFNINSESLFAQTWPSGLNAYRDWAGSVATSAALWSETVAQGHRVFVAEGGPSDFTADVLRAMPSSQRSSVAVVQHSQGWNQDNTRADNLQYVIDQANYFLIDNGNLGNNATADLNRQSQFFVNSALASQWGELWQAAFSYLSPDSKLDFSDTVELLWLLDIPLSQVADPDDFANTFFR